MPSSARLAVYALARSGLRKSATIPYVTRRSIIEQSFYVDKRHARGENHVPYVLAGVDAARFYASLLPMTPGIHHFGAMGKKADAKYQRTNDCVLISSLIDYVAPPEDVSIFPPSRPRDDISSHSPYGTPETLGALESVGYPFAEYVIVTDASVKFKLMNSYTIE